MGSFVKFFYAKSSLTAKTGVKYIYQNEKEHHAMNTIWILICGCLVFFMQAGFTCYEAGFVQSKNVISVAIENMFNLTITVILYTLLGFPIMFGDSILSGGASQEDYAFFFLQMMFATTSVTIFAGALSERTKLAPLLIAGGLSATVIYPVFGRLAWGSAFAGQPSWLEKLGFMDFAGASVIHMTAGFIALAGLLIVGKRTEPHTGKSNIPLAVLGVFILWFGWFGFNGGCLDAYDHDLSKVFVNTTLSASWGTVGALAVNLIMKRKGGYLLSLFNGVLSGLVAITALSAYCIPASAMAIGFVTGILAELTSTLIARLGIDDVVSVVPTHLVGGITGCLLLPLFVEGQYLEAADRISQLGVQFIGVCTNMLWAFGVSFIMFKLLKRITGLRVTKEEERKGLNIVEFNDIYSWENYIEHSSYEKEIKEKNDLLRKQSRLLAVTEEQEKKKLAKDLHDGVGQSLSALKVILGIGKLQAEKSQNEALMQNAGKAAQLADISIKEMRGVLNNLKPEALEKGGLKAGLEAMIENLNQIDSFKCTLNIEDPIPAFDDTIELNIYRLIQEALTNVVKHAHATEATVSCRRSDKPCRYTFMVKDDGIGFAPDKNTLGVGIPSMNDRLSMLNGKFDLYSMEGKGTTVIMEVPY